jgi:hypothetical protein
MSVSGRCELCQEGEVVDGCDRCGRTVCDEHYDLPSGLCVDCVSELGGDPTGRGRDDLPDGVGEYQF